jgi:hypothetical protein
MSELTFDYRPLAQLWVKADAEYYAACDASGRADEARRASYKALGELESKFKGAVSHGARTAVFLVNDGRDALIVTYINFSEALSFQLVKVTT